MSVDAAIALLLALINNASQVSALIAKAKEEGRTELSAAEWEEIVQHSDASQARLETAIRNAG